jgi:hypothetical protein
MSYNIALCFWGISRSLNYTYNTIKSKIFNVLDHNDIQYKTFGHFYELDYINGPRFSTECNTKANFEEYKLLQLDYFTYDNQNKTIEQLNIEQYYTKKDPWNNQYQSVKYFILSKLSQKKVTNLVKSSMLDFDYIVFLRPDVKYLDDFPVKYLNDIKEGDCAMPGFHLYGSANEQYKVNDRFCICRPNTGKQIGSSFDQLLDYSKNNQCHSETFLSNFLVQRNINRILIDNFIFQRVRANGEIPLNDIELSNK